MSLDTGQTKGEKFTGPRLRAPPWVLFTLIFACGPLLVVLFSYLDDPLWPDNDFIVENTHYVFSTSIVTPDNGWKPLVAYDPAEAAPELFSIWQRFEVDLNQLESDEQLALFLPYVWANLVIMIDKDRVAQTASMTQPMYMNRVPLMFPMARSQLERTGGVFHVRAVRDIAYHAPYTAYVGPYSTLEPSYDSHMRNRVYVAILSMIIIGLVGVAVTILFFISPPGNVYYGWFALTALLYGMHSAWYLIGTPLMSTEIWSTAARLTLVMGLTLVFFYHRYFGVRYRKIEFGASVLVLGAALFQLYAGLWQFSLFNIAQIILTYAATAVSIYATGFLLYAVWRWRNLESLVLAMTAMCSTWIFVRDCIFLVTTNVVPGWQFYLQYSSTVTALVFGLLLIRRFANSLRETEELNRHLERKVEDKVVELRESYAELSEEQGKRILADERARIMRDMHDGLGGQLVHAISLSDRDNNRDLQGVLRFALDDLRLIIDSLSPTENSLGAIVAAYRHRTTPMVTQHNIDLSWKLTEMDPDIKLPPKSALGVLRVIQEAVTNAVKHAQCDQLAIRLASKAAALEIQVSDNGVGIAPDHSPGRGINNIRMRVAELGGALNIESSSSGTQLRCTVAIPT